VLYIKRWMLCLLLLPACAQALQVHNGYVRGLPPGQPNTAAFMQLVNDTSAPLVITGAVSPAADKVELHQHLHQDGMMRMRRVDKLVLEPGEVLELAPGGYHLMMFGLHQPLADGEEVEIVLQLGEQGQQRLVLPVRSVLTESVRDQQESR
jgi:periplasmic copper chaperone A